MQSFLPVLALLVGAVAASSPSSKESTAGLSAADYLQRVLRGDVNLMTVPATPDKDAATLISTLGLQEAAKIAQQVNLNRILQESDIASVTLFLPTDEAVQNWKQKVPEVAADQTSLTRLVKAWMVRGAVMSSAMQDENVAQSVNGAKLRFNVYKKSRGSSQKVTTVNGARIIKANKNATNGVIHVVDKVIYPLPTDDVFKTMKKVGSFSTWVDLLQKAGLAQSLATVDPVTVFAPINSAFQDLSATTLEQLRTNQTRLQNFIKYHVIGDSQYSAGIADGQYLSSTQGDKIMANIENGQVVLNKNVQRESTQSTVVEADIPANNGVIHVIDHVLVPSSRRILV